jgi:hypothetical protein
MKRLLASMLAASCLVALASTVVDAQQPAAAAPAADQSAELAKKLSNPISDLVSVPLQFNWDQKVGPRELSQFVLNFQPVMPFELNENWNMIARVILPFIGQPPFLVNGEGASGIGDITASFFFSPKSDSGFTWGVGPAFGLPASYQPTIGSGHWSIGPTAVALKQHDKLTYGVLVNQLWSVAGDDRRPEVNQMFVEPFFAYQTTKTLTLTIQSESTADWEADTHTWTIPTNFEVAKLSTFGHFPASYQFGVGGYPAHPESGPSWKIRAAIIILLPKAEKK